MMLLSEEKITPQVLAKISEKVESVLTWTRFTRRLLYFFDFDEASQAAQSITGRLNGSENEEGSRCQFDSRHL